MSDDHDSTSDSEEPADEYDATAAPAVASTYKVRGELDADDGAGILGTNTADSGTPIGVQGAVPNNGTGYGLSTPDDARVSGIAELGGLAGSVTGNAEVTDLTGNKLDVDGSGRLGWTGLYRTETFGAAGSSWTPVSGLSSRTPIEVTLDATDQTAGRVRVIVDGVPEDASRGGETVHRILPASSSVTIESDTYYSFDAMVDVSSEEGSPRGLDFKGDGTKLFVTGNFSASVHSYDLSTAWDVTSASYNTSLDVSGADGTPQGVRFKGDGTKMFVLGDGTDTVYSYDVSTAWDLGTAAAGSSFDISSEETGPGGLAFRDDGSMMFLSGLGTDSIYSYTLSTAWDLSSASYSGNSLSVGATFDRPMGLGFTGNGSRMFVSDSGNAHVGEYALSTAWDITSASLDYTFDVSDEFPIPMDVAFQSDGSTLFLVGSDSNAVGQYPDTYGGTAFASVQRE